MDTADAVNILAESVRFAFEKEAKALQFHDQVIKLIKEQNLNKGNKEAAHKSNYGDPKAINHGSPLINKKRTVPEPSTKIQEKSAAHKPNLLRGAKAAAKKLKGGGPLDVGADKAVAALEHGNPKHQDKSAYHKNKKRGKKKNYSHYKKPMTKAYSVGFLLGSGTIKESL